MSLKSKAWAVATTLATVEAIKDQLGFCRWNHTLTSLHHHTKTNLKALAPDAKKLRSTAVISRKLRENQKLQKSDESMRAVMQLSCWVPN